MADSLKPPFDDKSGDGLSRSAKTERDPESCWQTPLWLVERVRDLMGSIDLDPCTVPDNPTKASRFYTPDDDGILQPWDADRIYVNPPYGRTIRHWVRKCVDAGAAGSQVVLLVPGRLGSQWFELAFTTATDVLFMRGRLQFVGASDPAKFPSVLFAWNVSLEGLQDLGVRALAA